MVSLCTLPARGGRSCERFGGYKTVNRIPLPLLAPFMCIILIPYYVLLLLLLKFTLFLILFTAPVYNISASDLVTVLYFLSNICTNIIQLIFTIHVLHFQTLVGLWLCQ